MKYTNYKSLYEFTSKITDDHIEFYKNKQTIPMNKLFDLWKNLSSQAETFDKYDWTQNWKNWHKNMPGFIGHKYEAKFLIQWYLTDVLETLIFRIAEFGDFKKTKKRAEPIPENISKLIKQEIRSQIKSEFAKKKKSH